MPVLYADQYYYNPHSLYDPGLLLKFVTYEHAGQESFRSLL